MKSLCAVINCPSRATHHRQITCPTFRFPKNPTRRLEWLGNINRPELVPKANDVLCMQHFLPKDIKFGADRSVVRLGKGAVPYPIYLPCDRSDTNAKCRTYIL